MLTTTRPTLLTLKPAASPAPVAAAATSAFDSRDLMRGQREVLINHGGQVYRLRHTRNDKLILVK